jgi:serine/threonine protein kinase
MDDSGSCRYLLDGRDLATVSNLEFVQASKKCPVICNKGTNVVRITKTAAMKIGFGVLEQEALAMKYVYEHSDGRIQLPRVYRSFVAEGKGYIVMEFVDGSCLDEVPWRNRPIQERQNIIHQVTEALLSLQNMRGNSPGPIGLGIPTGGLFTVYGAGTAFTTVANMEQWFNRKLDIYGNGSVSGKFKDLVMCHMDISLRNLMLDKTGGLWILDWAWAGFFPPEFEKAGLLHRRVDHPDFEFIQKLLCELELPGQDDALLALLLCVYQVNDGPFQGSHL